MSPYVDLCCRMLLSYVIKQLLATHVCLVLVSPIAYYVVFVLCWVMLSYAVLCTQTNVGHTCSVLPQIVLCCIMLSCGVLCCIVLSYGPKQELVTRVLFCFVCFNVVYVSYAALCCLLFSNKVWPHVF